MANANVNMNFNAFLEKTKLKDDGSNYSDWVRNLRIILIAAKKAYVLEGLKHPSQRTKMLLTLGSHVLMITPSFSAACFTA